MSAGRVLMLTLVVVAVPFIAAAVALVLSEDAPRDHDVALIEVRTGDVLSSDPPLVGSYERYGGNQPGPWLFAVLALPTALLGPVGMGLATLVVGYGSLAGMLAVARRRGGTPLVLWTALLSMVMVLGRGTESLANPWEPRLTLLVLGLFALLVWELGAGTTAVLPVVVAVGAFLAMTWATLAPIVAVLGAVALVAVALQLRGVIRDGDAAARRRMVVVLGVSCAVAVVMCLPPLLEQMTTDPGNLTELWEFSSSAADRRVGPGAAWAALGLQFDPWPVWVGRDVPVDFSGTVDPSGAARFPLALLVWLASVAGVGWVGVRHRASEPRSVPAGDTWWLHAVVAGVLVGSVLSMSLVLDEILAWSIEPSRLAGMLCWLAAGWSVAVVLRTLGVAVTVRRLAVPVLSVAVVAVSLTTAVVALLSDSRPDDLQRAVVLLADEADEVIGTDTEPVLVRSEVTANTIFGGEAFGVQELVALLERHGTDTVVEAGGGDQFGERRAQPESAVAELLLTPDAADPDPEGGWTMVATVDPLGPTQRSEREAIDRRLAELSGGLDVAELIRRAARDPELSDALDASFDLPDQPVLHLWYREER